ncbi:WD40-repeat-containing domain protein [Pilobolus umbonatus]|nr:WD40-repeat-containing domain protein [Pilobolus umbonatus]
MVLLTPSIINPSASKLLSYFPFSSHNKTHASRSASSKISDPNNPKYITIIIQKDGTPTAKCTNPRPPSISRRRCSPLSVHTLIKSPPKRRLMISSFIPKFNVKSRKNKQNTPISTLTADKLLVQKKRRLSDLPIELILQLLFFLDCPSLLKLSSTCKKIHKLCHQNNDYLWQTLFYADFFIPTPANTVACYYDLYRNHIELERRWRTGEVSTKYLTGHEDSVYCLVWVSPQCIVSGSRDKSIKVWDLSDEPSLRLTRMNHDGSVLCLRVSEDKRYLVSGSSDTTCLIWSLHDYEPIKRLHGHTGGVLDVCMFGNYVVSSSRDATIRVWDIEGNEQRRLIGHSGPVNALGSHGNQLVSASGDTTLKLWNVETGHCLRTFIGHTRGLACVRFDGEYIYSGGQDNKLKVWDVNTGRCISTLTGHSDLIRTIDSFENKTVSGSYDKTLKVWDTKSSKCLLSFQSGHSSWIFNCLLSRTKIVSAGQDKRIMILDFGYSLITAD